MSKKEDDQNVLWEGREKRGLLKAFPIGQAGAREGQQEPKAGHVGMRSR